VTKPTNITEAWQRVTKILEPDTNSMELFCDGNAYWKCTFWVCQNGYSDKFLAEGDTAEEAIYLAAKQIDESTSDKQQELTK
jgi:hypothetical protein